jgi:membrane fusion protein, multidrug efflux system
MNRTMATLITLIIAVSAFGSAAHAADETSVLVKTGKMARQTLSETLTGYGIVTPDAGSTESVGSPRAGRVIRLLVTTGQVVKKGQGLIEFATDPAASQTYLQAESAVEYAKGDLKRTEDMAALKLATQSQLAQAKKALTDAEAELDVQKKIGTGTSVELMASPFAGVVTEVLVGQGDFLQAGATAVRVSLADRMRVQLGIEPEDREKVKKGMTVRLTSVFGGTKPIDAQVDEVQNMIDPQTQLIGVVVKLGGNQCEGLALGTRLQGEITVYREDTWAVSRDALLKDDGGTYLFQVSNGKAHKVYVTPGIETDTLKGVSGKFDPALPVVVKGNYELEDGMAVRK